MGDRALRILFLTEVTEHASSHLRGFEPLRVLEEAGLAAVGIHSMHEVINDNPKVTDIEDPKSAIRAFARDVGICDVIVVPQTSALGWNRYTEDWKARGRVVVVDTDDDVRFVSPLSPTYETRGIHEVTARGDVNGKVSKVPLWKDGEKGFDIKRNKEWQESYWGGLSRADALTCPTERYAKELRGFCNPAVYPLPNSLDLNVWVPGRHPGRPKEFRVCWHGGDSHRMDVDAAAAGLGEFVKRHPEVTFVLMGAPLNEWRLEVPPDRLEYWDWTSYDAHPGRMMSLGADVGLCPVKDHRFNDAKSPLKWTEFGACGVPSICSNVPPYSDAVRDDEDGILVPNTPKAWLEALERVYADGGYRERIGAAARARMERDFNLHTNAVRWFEVYRELVDRKHSLSAKVA